MNRRPLPLPAHSRRPEIASPEHYGDKYGTMVHLRPTSVMYLTPPTLAKWRRGRSQVRTRPDQPVDACFPHEDNGTKESKVIDNQRQQERDSSNP